MKIWLQSQTDLLTALEKSNDNVGINTAWDSIRESKKLQSQGV